MIHKYNWGVNQLKVNRAYDYVLAQVGGDHKKVDEADVKARYVELGGLVREKTVAEEEVAVARRSRKSKAEDEDED